MLSGRNVVVAVSGGIAAYKTCSLVSMLKKNGANVRVMLTKHACEFVSPLTFEALSGNRAVVSSFNRNFNWDEAHISFSHADIIIVAPATANIIAKYAHGICDDFVSTTLTATRATLLFCPAMNTGMFNSDTVQQNLLTLRERGVNVLESPSGWLACGEEGSGRMAEPEDIFAAVKRLLLQNQDYTGKTVLVTAGGTREPLDPVRYIGNRSSGKMGIEIAKACAERGAKVTLVAGEVSAPLPRNANITIERVTTTQEMFDRVVGMAQSFNYVIKAAAPADYRAETISTHKLKTASLQLRLAKNPDIAAAVGENKGSTKLIIFCAETENLVQNAKAKLAKKNADMVVANDVTQEGAGFEVDTNIAHIITKDEDVFTGKLSKRELSHLILDRAKEL